MKFSIFFALCAALPCAAQQNVFSCPVMPSDAVFYARIDTLPVLPQSATWTAAMDSKVSFGFDSSLGVTASGPHGPAFAAQFFYTPGYNQLWRFPAYYRVDRQGGSLAGNNGLDHHSITVDHGTCQVWETYHWYISPATAQIETGTTCNGKPCNVQSGWTYTPTSYAMPTQGTTDAAGLPLLPLLARTEEILNGTLHHPIRFTTARGFIQAGHPIWPAVGGNGWGGTNTPPYGARFRLKASVNPVITKLTPIQQQYAQTIIAALKEYGLMLADVGSVNAAAVDDEVSLFPDVQIALATVGSQVFPTELEAVDVSSLETPKSYKAANQPAPAARTLVATPYGPVINVQGGLTLPLQALVNGANSGAVTWSLVQGNIGTVTAAGQFTAVANPAGMVSGELLAISTADPTASAVLRVRVFPSGPLRIAAGNQTSAVNDALGQTWLPNLFLLGGDSVHHAGDYPAWPKPANATQAAELAIYSGTMYTYGNDIVSAPLYVANGKYTIRMMFGQPYNGKYQNNCSPFPARWHEYLGLEAQNQLVVKNFDFGAAINHACAVPVDQTLAATVTDNLLEFAVRNTQPDQSPVGNWSVSPQINGVEILPAN